MLIKFLMQCVLSFWDKRQVESMWEPVDWRGRILLVILLNKVQQRITNRGMVGRNQILALSYPTVLQIFHIIWQIRNQGTISLHIYR